MAVIQNTNTSTCNVFKDSIKDLSIQDLENLYLDYRGGKEARAYMTSALAIALFVLSVFFALSCNFAASIGLCITAVFLGVYSYLKIHKNDHEEKVIEDLFKERGKQAIFQIYYAGFGGFSLKLIGVNV